MLDTKKIVHDYIDKAVKDEPASLPARWIHAITFLDREGHVGVLRHKGDITDLITGKSRSVGIITYTIIPDYEQARRDWEEEWEWLQFEVARELLKSDTKRLPPPK